MRKLNVLMIGTGEYTTGYVHTSASQSDKKKGVVALTLFDIRRRGKIGSLSLVGTTGLKNQEIRDHLKANIGDVYKNMDVHLDAMFPGDGVDRDLNAFRNAIDLMNAGDAVTIFTPDDTHYEMALYAIQRKLHVLIAKPAVQLLQHHDHLMAEAQKNGVLVVVEFHKRFDPIYADARQRIRSLGDFSFFSSYMSQPKTQLQTFKHWAGKSSDISFYLNAHHIDLNCWALEGLAVPIKVTASASTGLAQQYGCMEGTEDTITLMVQWRSIESGNLGTAVYTASWIASKAEVHSQQRFFYMGHEGEIRVDQAHRGYEVATDASGYASVNPLFMRYTPDTNGSYAGQNAYGHQSIEAWVDACVSVNQDPGRLKQVEASLPTLSQTRTVTAILEAGRNSLNANGASISIEDTLMHKI